MLSGITMKRLACLVCAALLLPLGSGSAAYAEQPAVSTGTTYPSEPDSNVVKPAWSTAITKPSNAPVMNPVTAVAENGKVFMLQPNGKLAALRATDGKKLWEYGSKLAQQFMYHKDAVYGMTASGSLYKIKENGSPAWTASLGYPTADSIVVSGSTLYVTQAQKMAAVDAASGKIKWQIAEDPGNYYNGSPALEAEGTIVRNYSVSGAITVPLIAVYDSATGRKLWESSRQLPPLTIKDGILYSEKVTFMMDDDPVNRKVEIVAFNLKSGAIKGERLYSWKDTANTDGVFHGGGAYSTAFLSGNDLYIFQAQRIVRYDFNNYVAGAAPLQKWNQEAYDQRTPLKLLHQGRLYFTNNNTHGLMVMKTATGQYVSFDQGGNPTAQAAVFGTGVYVGQTDGLLHAYDLLTAKQVFTVKTGSREFSPLLKTGGMLLIQTGGKLLGVKLPAALK